MMCICTYVCMYVSVTLRNAAVMSRRNVAVTHVGGLRNSENLAGQRSYVILLHGRRVEPGSIRRRPGGAFSHGGGEGRCRAFSEA